MAELYFSSKKVNLEELHQEFMKHATQINGFWYIGDPMGEDAYGYLRVSSDRQMEGSGIPRQIENLHAAALREHLRIPWDLIYGDDESGFFLERKGLSKLLEDSLDHRLASFVVIEDTSACPVLTSGIRDTCRNSSRTIVVSSWCFGMLSIRLLNSCSRVTLPMSQRSIPMTS